MGRDKNWVPYSCPIINEVIWMIEISVIEDKQKIIELMEEIRKINDDMRWVCKDFYNEKEDEKYDRLQAEKEIERLKDRIYDLQEEIKELTK